MKQNKNELDVDFIGGSGPLTKEEEKTISEFIKASKERRRKQKADKKHEPPTKVSIVPKRTERDNIVDQLNFF